MEGMGFLLQQGLVASSGDDWMLLPSAEAWERLVLCKAKLEIFSAKIMEAELSGMDMTSPAPVHFTSSSSSSASPVVDAAVVLALQQLMQALQGQQLGPVAAIHPLQQVCLVFFLFLCC
jgi:hypothetical protein